MNHATRTTIFVILILIAASAAAAPKAELWSIWEASDPASTEVVDHSAFGSFLSKYLVENDGVNLIRYGAVSERDKSSLDAYIAHLQTIGISGLSRSEQRPYWINLYNAFTAKLILDHYPVKSIRNIKLGGIFSSGPWDAKLLEIEGEAVSLNDIEHRILRPIWNDNRIHYAVNCASYSCPNLQPMPFTRDNTEELLESGARSYVNHDRGVHFDGNKLTVSSIYSWYRDDFGGREATVIEHLLVYADGDLSRRLEAYDGSLRDDYNWTLNELE
jgi:hypothetical protein